VQQTKRHFPILCSAIALCNMYTCGNEDLYSKKIIRQKVMYIAVTSCTSAQKSVTTKSSLSILCVLDFMFPISRFIVMVLLSKNVNIKFPFSRMQII